MATMQEQMDNSDCRTTRYLSLSKDLYLCLSEKHHLCPFSLNFGYSCYFCYHDDRKAMADSDPAISELRYEL